METQTQLDLNRPTDAEVETLRAWLAAHGWQTRRELAAGLNWGERKIRQVAEAMGAEIVRGQQGFKLTDSLQRDDLAAAVQAADAAISQGKGMIAYGFRLRKLIHQRVG